MRKGPKEGEGSLSVRGKVKGRGEGWGGALPR